jgi:amidase
VRASTYAQAHTRRIARWWAEGFDLLLTPTVAEPPPPLGTFYSPPEDPLRGFLRAGPFGTFTATFNATGQPAISLPLHWNARHLPIGVQLVAAYGREDLLIRVAAQLEQARPWADRRPPTHA